MDIYSEISQLYARLAESVDDADSAVGELFTDDGVFVAGNQSIAGADAIASYVSSMTTARTRHSIVNICLGRGDGEEQHATARCILFVENGNGSAIVASDYKSIFQNTATGWRFRRQEVTPAIRVAGAVS